MRITAGEIMRAVAKSSSQRLDMSRLSLESFTMFVPVPA